VTASLNVQTSICKTTGILKNQGNPIPPKEHRKLPVSDPKEMTMSELPDKGVKIIVLKMLREL